SSESRAALPYDDFVREYGPLSAAREMVLAKPESRTTRVEGDWAEITNSGILPESGRRLNLGVAAVKNQGTWRLVAARNEAAERVESLARSILRLAAAWRGWPDAGERLKELAAAETAKNNPVFVRYRFEAGGGSFYAIPLRPGLRHFHVDAWGEIRSGLSVLGHPALGTGASQSAPAVSGRNQPNYGGALPHPQILPSGSAASALAASRKEEAGGLPELSEPPANQSELPELAEPAKIIAAPAFEPDLAIPLPDAIR
ncbi:MAG: hypothetical protein LBV15_04405, partial [Planctomycetota bacterium]|nr:hypothetical protein [Planctomycetota bacterium]